MVYKNVGPVIADIDGVVLSQCDKEFLQHPQLGGLIFFSRNYVERQQLIDLVRTIREVRPELLLSVDQEGGRVQRFKDGFSLLPPMAVLDGLANQDDVRAKQCAQDLGRLMASELVQCDIDVSYAPVLDLDTDQSRVIGDRSFSSCPERCISLASAFISGMGDAGMMATAKHFPGHGGVVEDSHVELPIDPRNFDDIWSRDIQPFIALKDQYQAVMTAHIVFSDVDDAPVSFSEKWINEILRSKLNFEGVVLSDDLSMKGAANAGDMSQRAETALQAGCDGVLICNVRKEAEQTLEYLESRRAGIQSKLANLRKQPPKEAINDKTISQLQRNIDRYTAYV